MKFALLAIATVFTIVTMGYKAVSKINPEVLAVIEPDLSPENCVEQEFSYASSKECHCYLFQSTGSSNGSLKSPNFPHFYPINVGCILYVFVAALGELVEITLSEFDLRTRNKDGNCSDYLRIFVNLDRPEISEHDPWNYNFCGPMSSLSQTVFYSRHRVLIAEFHITGQYNTKFRGFKGRFNFLKRAQFKIDGNRVSSSPCRYEFKASEFSSGQFFSPNYPQNYPNHTECVYEFESKSYQRVIVDLQNIKMEHYRRRCDPVSAGDRVTVLDGDRKSDRVVGRFCGFVQARQFVSHGTRMTVKIQSDGNGIQGQGFQGHYVFVNKHSVQPSRILDDTMRGDGQVSVSQPTSSCDMQYLSSPDRKKGPFVLQKTPYEPKTNCLFTFQGEPGERVRIHFKSFQLDNANPKECRSYDGDRIIVYDGMSDAQQWLAVICGQGKFLTVVSKGRSMAVKFISDEIANPGEHGFEAQYEFVPKGVLVGTTPEKEKTVRWEPNGQLPSTDKYVQGQCSFNIRSRANSKLGTLQTPGYPNGFKEHIVCLWLFYGESGERVRIKITDFSLNKERDPDSAQAAANLPRDSCAGRDRLQIYKFHYQGKAGDSENSDEAPIELCGTAERKIFMSSQKSRLDVIFHSVGGSRNSARGIRFKYMFVKDFGVQASESVQVPGECKFIFSGLKTTNGSFTSPNYPGHYPNDQICDFIFKGRSHQTVSISFPDFDVTSADASLSCDNGPGDFIEVKECSTKLAASTLPAGYEGPRRLCGKKRNDEIYRIDWPASCLHIRFQSNAMDTSRGFFAYYSFSRESPLVSGTGTNGSACLYLSFKGLWVTILLFRIFYLVFDIVHLFSVVS